MKLTSTIYRVNPINIIIVFFLLVCLNAKGQNIERVNTPGARWGHVFIYYPSQKQILLFGGTDQRGGSYMDDTWIWNGNEWRKMDVQGPSSRGFCAYTFHEERNTIILHGGRGNQGKTYSDLWEWDGKSWSQIDDTSLFKADHHQMVYLKDQNSLFAFGGWNGKSVMGDTWEWNNKWEKLNVNSPPNRASFSMVNNRKTNSVNLYGGLWINGQYADIWTWKDNKWESISGPYDNSSLDHHSMIYDSRFERVIGFGGKNYRYQFKNSTFFIENEKIVPIDIEGPSGRHSFGFTFDSKENFGYLYGGKEYSDGQQIALGDFWKWDGKSWSKIE